MIYDILINLPSFTSSNSTAAFDIVLETTRSTLKSTLESTLHADQQGSRSDLKGVLPLLFFAAIVASEKPANESRPVAGIARRSVNSENATRLLDFYLSLLAPEGLLPRKRLVNSVTPYACISFSFYFGQSFEKGDGLRQNIGIATDSTDQLVQMLEVSTLF